MRIILFLACLFSQFLVIGQTNELHHRARINIQGKSIILLSRLGLEVDHGIHVPHRYIENDYAQSELDRAQKAGFEYEIIINDVISHYQNPNRPSELDIISKRDQNCGAISNSCTISDWAIPVNYSGGSMAGYKTYEELIPHLDSMALLYPNLITSRININEDTTHMGNKIFYLKISDNPSMDETSEPKVLYTSLHHAREPNSLSQMLFFMWYVLENYETDPEIKAMVDRNELYFVPVVNPDGYMINAVNNPNGGGLWRKNAWRDESGELFGVDLNRNYGYFWGFDNSGSSPNPSSNTFRGDSLFSEPETTAIKDLCESKNFLISQNYHTFGNLLIHPWGYNDEPTDEDVIFKGLGNEMIKENCFVMGTGTETVGYVVNGDADDWMYGEEITKDKIYSFTPEVGPSFWPPMSDIMDLNKSCMAMNISTAQLTSNIYNIATQTNGPITSQSSQSLNEFIVDLTKIGLGSGAVSVIIEGQTSNILGSRLEQSVDKLTSETETISFPFTIANDTKDGEQLEFYVSVAGEGYSKEKVFTFNYYRRTKEVTSISSLETLNDWSVDGDWGVTDEYVYEGSNSLADSPYSEYRRNAITYAVLNKPLDLREAIFAELTFAARWEIESGFDFAMIQASLDNVNWIPLCGRHTRPGSINQVEGEPLFDGFQSDWVEEAMPLLDFVGEEKVYIRAVMSSDGFVEEEGIYIDDIKLNIIQEAPSGIPYIDNLSVIYPNPTDGLIHFEQLTQLTRYRIYDTNGSVLGSGKVQKQLDLSYLSNGIYFIHLNDGQMQQVSKVIKM